MVLGGVPVRAQASAGLHYPQTPRSSQTDDIGGQRVADPYRWLENTASPEVRGWVTAQNALTESFLAQTPARKHVQDLIGRAANVPKLGAPFGAAEKLFFSEGAASENQPVLYVQDRVDAPPHVLIDPNAFSKDGLIAVVRAIPSPDARYIAYAVTTQGSAWRVIRVRDVRTGQDTGDELKGIEDSTLAWTRDAHGFFYVRSDAGRATGITASPFEPDGRSQVFYHRLGRPQSDDRLMYENPSHPDWRLHASISTDGEYLLISAEVGSGLSTRLYFIDLDNPKRPNLAAPIVKLFDSGDAVYDFVANEGQLFFIRTTKNAPHARLVGVDINAPDENHWTPIIRETFDPLIDVRRVDDRFVAHRLKDAHSVLELFSLDGGARGTVSLPGVGSVTELHERSDNRDFYYTYTSFLQPTTIYRYDLDTRASVAYAEPRVDSTLAQYETTQLFFTSKDGTRVPMFITAKRGITLDGNHPVLLEANGAFNENETPKYSPFVVGWLQLGGIYAVANVRGGGESGRAWHTAATGVHKQTSMDDFMAAVEFLISQRYTHPGALAVAGRGAGALLVEAVVEQHPEMFACALLDAGVFDMVRYPRFTRGASWIPEFGAPDKANDLKALLAYSPLQNVRAGTRYPATLVTVGDHDDLFPPPHSYKLVAALQWAIGAANSPPQLLRVDYDSGHGPGTPTDKLNALDAARLSFLATALHVVH